MMAVTVSSVGPLRADTSAPHHPSGIQDSARTKAESLFAEGLRLANANRDWEGALSAFLESRKTFPTRSATRNAAIALRHLGRFAEAYQLYGALLQEFSIAMSPEQRAGVEGERRALLDYLGGLEVRIQEPGVNVVVDGQQRGVTPMADPLYLDVGIHTVRLSKAGFETLETQSAVVAGTIRKLTGTLKPLSVGGTLIVSATNDQELDVVIDGAIVGRTPWRGTLPIGRHSVLLRGKGDGTAPVTVEVQGKQVRSLRLRVIPLDASVQIQPTPEAAMVFVDGVFVGSGAWSGPLPSGSHRLEVVAPGYATFRRDVVLNANQRAIVRPVLSPTDTRPVEPVPVGLHVEATIGPLLARSLRGSVDDACDCETRERPFGWLVLARAGYQFAPAVALELGVGYLSLREQSQRSVIASSTEGKSPFSSDAFSDVTALDGPMAAFGVKLATHRRSRFTTRVMTGLAWLNATFDNGGLFQGFEPGITGPLNIAEPDRKMVAPWFSTELRYGFTWGPYLHLNAGVALLLLLPPPYNRTARWGSLGGSSEQERKAAGVLALPDEPIARPFLALSPGVSGRVSF